MDAIRRMHEKFLQVLPYIQYHARAEKKCTAYRTKEIPQRVLQEAQSLEEFACTKPAKWHFTPINKKKYPDTFPGEEGTYCLVHLYSTGISTPDEVKCHRLFLERYLSFNIVDPVQKETLRMEVSRCLRRNGL